jgi:TRAP-type C4-dicarboxylate transport system substrate-binding protein
MSVHTRAITAAAAAAVIAFTVPASAKEMEITVVGGPPPAVTFVGTFKDIVSVKINERLKAEGHDLQIKWNHAYSQTVAKFPEVFEAVEEGIGGAGLILKNFEPSNLPLEAYSVYMPFFDATRTQLDEIDKSLRAKIPELNATYAKHNQVFITSGVNDSMHLFTKFPVTKFEDIKDRKLGSSGSFGQWLRGTGAVSVNSSMAQSYTNIKNGVYDGYPISVILSFVYKTWSAAPYFTEVSFGPSNVSAITFNTSTWKSLPSYAHKIIHEEAAKWVGYQDKADDAKRGKFLGIMKKRGVKFGKLPEAERQKWANTLPNIAKEWADRLEEKGQPGTKIMKAFMDELRARKITFARNWDTE